MPTPYDLPASLFIQRLATYLKDNVDDIQPPAWAQVVKTSSHTENPPQNKDWWFTRCASILRKIYIEGPIGTERLRARYGGRTGRVVRREHARKGAGSNIRKALQQLEAARLVETRKNKGRVLTSEGRRVLDKLATETKEELEKTMPELKKY